MLFLPQEPQFTETIWREGGKSKHEAGGEENIAWAMRCTFVGVVRVAEERAEQRNDGSVWRYVSEKPGAASTQNRHDICSTHALCHTACQPVCEPLFFAVTTPPVPQVDSQNSYQNPSPSSWEKLSFLLRNHPPCQDRLVGDFSATAFPMFVALLGRNPAGCLYWFLLQPCSHPCCEPSLHPSPRLELR